jgi:hypothetical protein
MIEKEQRSTRDDDGEPAKGETESGGEEAWMTRVTEVAGVAG